MKSLILILGVFAVSIIAHPAFIRLAVRIEVSKRLCENVMINCNLKRSNELFSDSECIIISFDFLGMIRIDVNQESFQVSSLMPDSVSVSVKKTGNENYVNFESIYFNSGGC